MQPGTSKVPPHLRGVGLPSSGASNAAGASHKREVMNAEEAADFLRIPYDNFRRLAAGLPRHRVTERRYVYLRQELIEWLMRR